MVGQKLLWYKQKLEIADRCIKKIIIIFEKSC